MKYLTIGLALLALSTAGVVPALSKTAHYHAARHAVWKGTPAPLYLYSHNGYFGGPYYLGIRSRGLELNGIRN
jgi:hypothetical protein